MSLQSHSNAGPYVLHHRNWWNYYERGRLYLKENDFEKAALDFAAALGRTPGARTAYAQERWKARTYGMHMIEGYFPHRELGICFFHLNRTDDALDLLKTSMDMEPSARARFYLNRIREQQAIANAPPPQIKVTSPIGWTAERTLLLEGVATGSNAVAGLIVNDQPEFIELASRQVNFRRDIALQEGLNSIQITARDLSGKQTSANLEVIADWTPPQISLQRKKGSPTVICRDNLALGQIRLNGQEIAPSTNVWSLAISSGEPLQLSATDRSGNRVEWSLSAEETSYLTQNRPAAPPKLDIADSGKTITLYNPEYALDIRAEDDTALRSVELNGRPLLSADTPLFRTLCRIPLVPGTNRLALAAVDNEDNRVTRQVSVIYRPPEYLDSIYRLAATLPPLSGEIPDFEFGRHTESLLLSELTEEPVRFYLLAAKQESNLLMKEQLLSDSDLADPRARLEQNLKLDTDLRLVTRVLNDGRGHTLYTAVFDADSSEPLFVEDVYLENTDWLPQQVAGLIMKIEQRFPLIQARVAKDAQRLIIDAGEKDGAYKGMRFLVIRSDGGFEQGKVLQAGNRPAELVISKVESQTAFAILFGRHPDLAVRAGDYVFAR
ncbi:tetratricopeptide repeat protein [Tichowtungia aerotolerans]|uniref:Tetratricopeptide repeat protein n=1 Tax=Tichowtungia aerotolerans TaxID=2697043 RepID=A0A6P1M2L0_9BACT|nr:hypothetical protein [Tichowtungia aerotolerans]QHI69069.1 hypothetical protein GT409_06290 [Tichowtungia aerotolerans]